MSKLEYRAIIKLKTLKGLKPLTIETEMQFVYGDSTPSFSTIEKS